ncbi:MAG TPA: DNA repair protein RecN, partial [Thermomicrobiales bacterium]|nr:DNA repair protein RecN [Thermomicrobiales bacterium]
GALGRIGQMLVDIHGQSDHLSLLRPSEHLDLLDRFADTLELRAEVARLVGALREIRARIGDIRTHAREREQRADLLRFQSEEIAAAQLTPGEDEALAGERQVLANAERLATDAAAGYDLITGGEAADERALPALAILGQAAQFLEDIARIDESAQPIAERLREFVYLLEDAAAEVRTYRDRIEADPARLAEVEERLAELQRLKRKYGATLDEVIAFGEQAEAELAALTGEEADVDALQARETALLEALGELATDLSARRQAAAEQLAHATEAAIAELNMGRARFAVRVEQVPDERGVPVSRPGAATQRVAFDATGIDRVEFLIAPNAGEALKPLARVASGGETARLMLALKSILSAADATPTLVFDEVDVGVGGRSGQVVGEKLWGLASGHQVVVISHLPQIAAFAETHFRIGKAERGERVVSEVEQIDGAARIDELAAMLDGSPVTSASRDNARAMLARVERWKAERAGAAPAKRPA